MTTGYVPTTDEVRGNYSAVSEFYELEGASEQILAEGRAEFDRWLADHDREIAAKALELTDRELQEGVGAMYRGDLLMSNVDALKAALKAIAQYREEQKQ